MEARGQTVVEYDMAVVRGFALSAVLWGVVGMLVGLLAAIQGTVSDFVCEPV